jgi:uncharacterized membrane protein YjfL (UPF0719 family)
VNDAALRDRFLAALDAGNRAASMDLAGYLTGSMSPLPSVVCAQLGLPAGSAYSVAAHWVLARGAAE